MGVAFAGTIDAMRALTVTTDGCFEYSISLDEPIVVFGTKRDHVLMYAKFDGTPSSYTRHTDHITS